MNRIGLYVHVPFCVSKCPYCDFYSLPTPTPDLLDRYTQAVIEALDRWADTTDATADTLYFGGGTPSLMGGERLGRLISHADKRFRLFSGNTPEVTMEANPADDLEDTLRGFVAAGGNRLSLGMQSTHGDELAHLGRRHTPQQTDRAVQTARRVGFNNISLDLMLGIPGQTVDTAVASAHQIAEWGIEHASAYMLKLEPNTPFGQQPPILPDDDRTADIYLAVMEALDSHGYGQYEISNTARPGFYSRHNYKYWNGDFYLGIGPAASSYMPDGRFAYPRDVRRFMQGGTPMPEQEGSIAVGSPEEYGLLRLRLADGISEEAYAHRFSCSIPADWMRRADALPHRLVTADKQGIRLTREGFLVSNLLICHILAI